MEMVASTGFLALLAGFAGLSANDLASFVPPDDYFMSRSITVNAEEMMALAGKDADTPKAQLQRLLAIRWLGENAAAKKKGARVLLAQIAGGKKAQDPFGFSKAHALRSLALIDGKPPPPLAPRPANSLRQEALTWFPADLFLAGGFDLRGSKSGSLPALEALRKSMLGTMSDRDRKEFYTFAEKIGNVRIDRIVLGYRLNEQKEEPRHQVLRITAAGDVKAVIAAFEAQQGIKFEQRKGPSGETLLATELKKDAVLAFVGARDLLFCFDGDAKPTTLLDEVLTIKAGKKKSVADGPLAKLVEQSPSTAHLLFAAQLPERLLKQLTSAPTLPFQVFPEQVLLYAVLEEKMMVTAQGTLKTEKEAAAFKDALLAMKQLLLKQLDNAAGAPREFVKEAKDALDGGRISVDDDTVKVTVDGTVLLKAVPLWLAAPRRAPDK